jgi:hypothetical protein
MAGYLKDIELESGATAGYHVVQRITGTFPLGELRVEVIMESYASKKAFDDGKSPMEVNTYLVNNENVLSALASTADGLVLSLTPFAGAKKG